MKKQTYVITAAQMGAKVNERFFNSLLKVCKEKNAKLKIVKLGGKGNLIEDYDEKLEPYLLKSNTEFPLNTNVSLHTLKISPTAENPLGGNRKKRMVRSTSMIFGHPQICFQPIANSNNKLPRIMITTGAVTEAYYPDTTTGFLAAKEHKLGAVIVDVIDDVFYLPRHLLANGNGEVHDMGEKFTTNQVLNSDVEALVMGDTHVGCQCPLAQKATEEQIKEFKPNFLVFHDLLDSYSINHHHEGDIILSIMKAINDKDNLEAELEMVADYLLHMKTVSTYGKNKSAKMIVVRSNHDEALDRYLKEGRFFKNHDWKNFVMATKLMLDVIESKKNKNSMSPLEIYVKKYSKAKDKLQDVRFLSRDEDLRIEGVQVANHGDLGANGGPASNNTIDIGVGDSIIGHTHVPWIFQTVMRVGTMTLLKLGYNRGLSSWMNANGIIHKGGMKQLLLIIAGRWKK